MYKFAVTRPLSVEKWDLPHPSVLGWQLVDGKWHQFVVQKKFRHDSFVIEESYTNEALFVHSAEAIMQLGRLSSSGNPWPLIRYWQRPAADHE